MDMRCIPSHTYRRNQSNALHNRFIGYKKRAVRVERGFVAQLSGCLYAMNRFENIPGVYVW